MDDTFWQKQTDKAIFPDVVWSRPEQKAQAKKLLIIGGHSGGFDQVGRVYQAALDAGIGHAKVVLPDRLKPSVGIHLPDAVFANLAPEPKLRGGALNQLMAYADWADGVVFTQTGNNSQTALLTAAFIQALKNRLIVTDDLLELLAQDAQLLVGRPDTLFVLSFSGLQNLVKLAGSEVGLRHDMGLRPFVLALRELNQSIGAPLNVIFEQEIVSAHDGQIVTTPRQFKPDPLMLAGWMATWWLQQPHRPIETLSAVVMEF